ncbi:hypothetical protein [Ruminococcus flavefaciens]|uniref:Uncharacterized protein n=1 Tax=Ruminococcus flavefaciens TaxID=1265 RepID=A0A1M7H819_RUMFL|nr:hypothetical protein [Ruminococcus flavefaciens]SHM24499.1 hypothetical protein SAMN04487860_102169 [Ruminococcus flavefaciens]
MSLKRITASAVCVMAFWGVFGVKSSFTAGSAQMLTAYADEYDFDYVDEYDYEEEPDIDGSEIDDIELDEIDSDADISVNENRGTKRKHNVISSFVVSLLIGLISALIAVSIMKSSMKSVRKKAGAADYRKENSFKLTKNTDTFMYKRVEKIAIPKNNQPNK